MIRLLAKVQRVTVVRFVKESDADGFAQALRRLEPHATFTVVFDLGSRQPEGDREKPRS